MIVDPKLAGRMNDELERDLEPQKGRLGKVKRYLEGDHDLPYMPKGASGEFLHLAQRSVTNWTPLLSDTYGKGLFVDGYRPAKAADNSTGWSYWQANGLDARQSVAHRGAFEYGASYTLILPGTVQSRRVPLMRPLSPLRSMAWYRDEDDEHPELALRRVGKTADGTQLLEMFDKTNVYTFARPKDYGTNWILSSTDEHGLGVTPFVRFRDRLDGDSVGIIRPLIGLQDRINEIVFSTLIAIQYASFRQRWATGLAIPVKEVQDPEHPDDPNATIEIPVEPFEAAVNRLWVAEDEQARFGDFAQTELSGHAAAYKEGVGTFASLAQISPNIFTGDLVNISAEALAQMERSTQLKLGQYETLFGEAWESAFRLAAHAARDTKGAVDFDAQVRWRDTEARSMAQTVDALGKVATMLQVPVEALWDRIPGVTDQDVIRWKALRQTDPLADLVATVAKQTATANTPVVQAPTNPAIEA